MSAHVLPAVSGRSVVRCDDCRLVQFKDEREYCLRCHKAFVDGDDELVDEPDESTASCVGNPGRGAPTARNPVLSFPFGCQVRIHRQNAGLSQRQLAIRIGWPRTYVSKIERGTTPNLENIERLARGLGISVRMLIAPQSQPVEIAINDPFVKAIADALPGINQRNREYLVGAVRRLAATKSDYVRHRVVTGAPV